MAGGHGGNLRALALRAEVGEDQILDFSASVNPLGPPEGLRAALSRAVQRIVHYPDPDCAELVGLLAGRYRVAPEQIVVGNGSSEILFALARACDYDRAVVPVPAYIDYAEAARAAGHEVHYLPLEEKDGFGLDWNRLDSELRPRDLALLGQPNNPTGRLLDNDELRRVVARHPETMFVVDEAFADFVEGYRSLVEPLPQGTIVMRSLTKFYAVPGLRLGCAVAAAPMAQRIKRQTAPWSVNSLAQDSAACLLADEDYARRTIALVSQERRWLSERLSRIAGLHVYPSDANFLLVRVDRGDLDAPRLAQRLLTLGIAIRTFDRSQHLDERFFRVAVRVRDENQRLCEALEDSLVGARPRPAAKRRRAAALMIQGTSSNAGKSILTAALCRILLQDGIRVAPFKSQNMSLNSFVTRDGGEMGRAQVVQAQACRIEPDVRMNPVLLKPNSDTGCQVIVRGQPVGNMRVGEYVAYKPQAWLAVRECYDTLADEYDAVVIEGAGSPGEVNLKSHDIVNMRVARHAEAPVLIAGDIDRGGVFASFVGTMEVLSDWERKLVAGWIVNRFRGDASLLAPALDYTLRHTGRPVLGVVPYLPSLDLPEEDSVEFKSGSLDQATDDARAVEIAVIDLPHISNFTDFDALRGEHDVRLRIIRSAAELNGPDAVLIPGSKNTLGDLDYLRRSGLAMRIEELANRGKTEIVGICAGLQILGREIRDPLGIESAAVASRGLGLLDVSTVLAAEKTLQRTTAVHGPSGLEVAGYEIHHGQTATDGATTSMTRADGRVVGVAHPERAVWGTYLHGVFDADAFRRWFIDRLRVRRGLPPVGEVVARYDIEASLDRLADAVRRSLAMDEIYRLMRIP